MSTLEQKLGYTFRDKELLQTALTHSSYANENKREKAECNERLEFLGDSILGMIVADHLFKKKPKMPEGDMTRRRAELVCEKNLVQVAAALDLGDHLRLGRGERQGGGDHRPSIVADAVEAVIAAAYLDGGLRAARGIVGQYILSEADETEPHNHDYKTALQEFVQRKPGSALTYHTIEESGPDHMKLFVVEVRLNGERIGTGRGRNKKEAEQASAKDGLERLTK